MSEPIPPEVEGGAEAAETEDWPTFRLPPDGAPHIRLHRPTTPIGQMHETAGNLGAPDLRGGTFRVDHLYGPHGLKYPILALLVRRHLGPVRHALSQRTVAGGLKVTFAPGDRPAVPPAHPSPPASPPVTPTPQ
jgi:hypothetical protein